MKVIILFTSMFLTLTVYTCKDENKNRSSSKKNTDGHEFAQTEKETLENKEYVLEEISSLQKSNVLLILNALQYYTKPRMKIAIQHSFDSTVILNKGLEQIMSENTQLLKELRKSVPIKIISDEPDRLSLKMKHQTSEFIFDIYFNENSQKILKMGFVKLKN